ncbi:hypothetical protein LOK49_LG01G02314 [Camellia lanceoleosa]|uniref:Uncharacterized protein n=1 Tax=Camellia lanceoleosa TaxID=1840588 RepID=A0ACC0J318_9ERIC|nr:hypothetical protein LOK49_LG01G02314 [Camellia lanceoleosa]
MSLNYRSKAECPVPEEMVTASVDGSVLDRIAKIMSCLRLGSSGKVLKKKKKEREVKAMLYCFLKKTCWPLSLWQTCWVA